MHNHNVVVLSRCDELWLRRRYIDLGPASSTPAQTVRDRRYEDNNGGDDDADDYRVAEAGAAGRLVSCIGFTRWVGGRLCVVTALYGDHVKSLQQKQVFVRLQGQVVFSLAKAVVPEQETVVRPMQQAVVVVIALGHVVLREHCIRLHVTVVSFATFRLERIGAHAINKDSAACDRKPVRKRTYILKCKRRGNSHQ